MRKGKSKMFNRISEDWLLHFHMIRLGIIGLNEWLNESKGKRDVNKFKWKSLYQFSQPQNFAEFSSVIFIIKQQQQKKVFFHVFELWSLYHVVVFWIIKSNHTYTHCGFNSIIHFRIVSWEISSLFLSPLFVLWFRNNFFDLLTFQTFIIINMGWEKSDYWAVKTQFCWKIVDHHFKNLLSSDFLSLHQTFIQLSVEFFVFLVCERKNIEKSQRKTRFWEMFALFFFHFVLVFCCWELSDLGVRFS